MTEARPRSETRPAPGGEPRFAPGDRVRVRVGDPGHHTRRPRYVRGQRGVIVESQGPWPLADESAQGLDPRSEVVYTVGFAARDLWGSGAHTVTVDLWESYLLPAEPETEEGDRER
ncbi:MAG: nitrile hydratase subunit beta [Streptosporangiales bacterium]|nr:nitrile hydratase subunit beta [Streptosporangiales bacterium]